jgi:hypothetical protein
MRMVPSQISLEVVSNAERRMFELLRKVDLGEGSCAFHSLNLPEHEFKIMSEIDFVVLSPMGVLVLEVKGGRVDRDGRGIWTYTNRFGEQNHRSSGPFEQARTAMWAMKRRLEPLVISGDLHDVVFGHGVIFPDIRFDVKSVEWTDEMVIDQQSADSISGLKRALVTMLRYWRQRSGKHANELGPSVRKELERALRPSFERLPSLKHLARQMDERLEALTESQYRYLDLLEGNRRILCEGGAGSGKTFLAAEIARREIASGSRTLVTCLSPILERFLDSQLKGSGVDVIRLDRLHANSSGPWPYDVLIVDEAQDLMNLDHLAELDAHLTGGLENGKWRIFQDSNNQSGLLGSFDPDALALVHGAGVVAHLPDNCRNTQEIISRTKLLTGADLGVTIEGKGPEVRFEFYDDLQDEGERLERFLDELADDGIDLDLVTLLTFDAIEGSCINLLSGRWKRRVTPIDTTSMSGLPIGKVGVCSVADFKGLENRFVAILDVGRIDRGAGDLGRLYVAMTRARVQLWIGIDVRMRETVRMLEELNLSSVIGDMRS